MYLKAKFYNLFTINTYFLGKEVISWGLPGGSNLPGVWEARIGSLGQEDPLEEEMATHSSILAWKIPWTEEPGGLQPIGSQRARYDWRSSGSSWPRNQTRVSCVAGIFFTRWDTREAWGGTEARVNWCLYCLEMREWHKIMWWSARFCDTGHVLSTFREEKLFMVGVGSQQIHGYTRGICSWFLLAASTSFLSPLFSSIPRFSWRRQWQPTPVFLPGESQGRRSLVGCRLWGRTELKWLSHSSSSQVQCCHHHRILKSKRNLRDYLLMDEETKSEKSVSTQLTSVGVQWKLLLIWWSLIYNHMWLIILINI